MTIPRATYTRTSDVRLRFPFSRRLVTALKAEIPGYARSYDPTDKTWTVVATYATVAVRLILSVYPHAAIRGMGSRTEPAAMRVADRALAELHLLPSAPPELIAGAYRILARLRHPDLGGDPEAMTRLNDARDLLRERMPA